MAGPVWFRVRRALGHEPIVAGAVGGANPLFVERYLFHDVERTVPGLDAVALVVQIGGGRVQEGERDRWRSTNLPTQSQLMPRNVPTHWHYSSTVDFAVFYLPDQATGVTRSLEVLAASRREPMPFGDVLVGAAAQQLVEELRKAGSADTGFLERLAGVMLEQAYRALVTPAGQGIHPAYVHFSRLQAVLNHVHSNLAGDLSAAALAARADISLAHFSRIFREATGVPPHRYVMSARLDLARKLLTQSALPVSRIAQECGFSSQSHLTACFRAAHSTTPARYRSDLRKTR